MLSQSAPSPKNREKEKRNISKRKSSLMPLITIDHLKSGDTRLDLPGNKTQIKERKGNHLLATHAKIKKNKTTLL